ncbi:hypothetical protein GCM10007301_34750 [Azorhizobium oxalatiphilum]|uniref:Transmembrane protein n=1 Tax=Azorhizobium oxalatiphilum TaxID=980631 RepID=A0A917FD40_9HYPH|nr:hypothetical protein [Azorhizobium oxalatiphilum]GGF72022.1 hypothetical protein GCM10007301_34750 [Azorhizobium oxalatiphilum]
MTLPDTDLAPPPSTGWFGPLRSHGWKGVLALVVLFAVLGPPAGALPLMATQLIGAIKQPVMLHALGMMAGSAYLMGVIPAVNTALLVCLLCPRHHPAAYVRVWVCTLVSTFVWLGFLGGFPGMGMPRLDGVALMTLGVGMIVTLPAATWCCWVARKLKLL